MDLRLNVDRLMAVARERGHLRHEDIASHAGVDRSTLNRTIRGALKLSVRMHYRLALAYGLSMEELLLVDQEAAA